MTSILMLLLIFISSTASSQFQHRFHISAGPAFSSYKDYHRFTEGYIQYYEDILWKGQGFNLDISYSFSQRPITLGISYQNGSSEIHWLESNLKSDNEFSLLHHHNISLNAGYTLFRRSALKPVMFFGFNLNSLHHQRKGITYYYTQEYLTNLEWGYENVTIKQVTPGITGGFMLKYRATDWFGAYYKQSVIYLKLHETEWLNQDCFIWTNSLGLYFRLSKRTKLIL